MTLHFGPVQLILLKRRFLRARMRASLDLSYPRNADEAAPIFSFETREKILLYLRGNLRLRGNLPEGLFEFLQWHHALRGRGDINGLLRKLNRLPSTDVGREWKGKTRPESKIRSTMIHIFLLRLPE